MSKLLISTQVLENYGAHDWDYEVGVPQYWKPKGGRDYVVPNFTDYSNVTEFVAAIRGQIETNSEYYREYIVDWKVVSDDYLTQFEQDQLEFEGVIRFPAKVLVLS